VTKAELTIAEATAMFLHVATGMQASQDLLTQADKAIGDGDHGVGMNRGFAAVQAKLEASPPTTVADLLKTTGMALLTSIGGASGVIFGTLFRGGARNLTDATIFNAETLSLMLADGLAAVQERGKANPGDKTMVDALTPAAAKAAELAASSLDEALPAVAHAARLGMEETKGMVAATGKARALGPRALGFADPGALSMYLILDFMAQYVTSMESQL
jgi:phosphoenolpyruvate---glycerone phosphotransferase subunit DhaL